jgi:hypothetical protein
MGKKERRQKRYSAARLVHPNKKRKPASNVPEHIQREIEQRALEIYQLRRGGNGSRVKDWLQAEREIKQKYHLA